MNPAQLLRTDRVEKNVTEQIKIVDNSKERVALELMHVIAGAEFGKDERLNTAPREYYLKLYAQCISTIARHSYKEEER